MWILNFQIRKNKNNQNTNGYKFYIRKGAKLERLNLIKLINLSSEEILVSSNIYFKSILGLNLKKFTHLKMLCNTPYKLRKVNSLPVHPSKRKLGILRYPIN